jgi:hypothetical protein
MHNSVQILQQIDEVLELLPDELQAAARTDYSNVKSEQVVWESILWWINHDRMSRKGNTVDLMKTVRLGQLDP